MARFDDTSIPPLDGRTFVITGGNSGIGLEAGVLFARRGARVILACRDPGRAEAAVADARLRSGGDVRALSLDLASLASVRSFEDRLAPLTDRIDVLVDNAGVMALPYGKTEDGFERQMGTNHIGHFVLTLRLLPFLERAERARVVVVSSLTHKYGHVDLGDLNGERSYSPSAAYANSKLANLLFAYELDRRLKARGSRVLAVACHPGMSATQITMGSMKARGSEVLGKFLVWGNGLIAQPADRGALPTAFAATHPSIRGGEYVGPTQLFGWRGEPGIVRSSATSHDAALAKGLWEASTRLTGESLA